jgi:hypothetical protein
VHRAGRGQWQRRTRQNKQSERDLPSIRIVHVQISPPGCAHAIRVGWTLLSVGLVARIHTTTQRRHTTEATHHTEAGVCVSPSFTKRLPVGQRGHPALSSRSLSILPCHGSGERATIRNLQRSRKVVFHWAFSTWPMKRRLVILRDPTDHMFIPCAIQYSRRKKE